MPCRRVRERPPRGSGLRRVSRRSSAPVGTRGGVDSRGGNGRPERGRFALLVLVTLLCAFVLALAFVPVLLRAVDLVLKGRRGALELATKRRRDLAVRDGRVDGLLQLVGVMSGPARVAAL